MIRDYQAIMKTWFPVGKQRIIPTYGKHEGVKLVGFLNYETGSVYVEEHKKYITQSCCRTFWKKTVNAWSLFSYRHTAQTLTKPKNYGAGLKTP